jgi:hypothetical protein
MVAQGFFTKIEELSLLEHVLPMNQIEIIELLRRACPLVGDLFTTLMKPKEERQETRGRYGKVE